MLSSAAIRGPPPDRAGAPAGDTEPLRLWRRRTRRVTQLRRLLELGRLPSARQRFRTSCGTSFVSSREASVEMSHTTPFVPQPQIGEGRPQPCANMNLRFGFVPRLRGPRHRVARDQLRKDGGPRTPAGRGQAGAEQRRCPQAGDEIAAGAPKLIASGARRSDRGLGSEGLVGRAERARSAAGPRSIGADILEGPVCYRTPGTSPICCPACKKGHGVA